MQPRHARDPGPTRGRKPEKNDMDAKYVQCRAARIAGFKDSLVSISPDDSFGKCVVTTSSKLVRWKTTMVLKKHFWLKSYKRNVIVNQSLSASSDLGKLACISCGIKHDVISKDPAVFSPTKTLTLQFLAKMQSA